MNVSLCCRHDQVLIFIVARKKKRLWKYRFLSLHRLRCNKVTCWATICSQYRIATTFAPSANVRICICLRVCWLSIEKNNVKYTRLLVVMRRFLTLGCRRTSLRKLHRVQKSRFVTKSDVSIDKSMAKKWFTGHCSWYLLLVMTFFLKWLIQIIEDAFEWSWRKKKILQKGQNNIEKFWWISKTLFVVNLLRNFFARN